MKHLFHPSILRAYDIRGVVGETLGTDDARALGRAFALAVTAAGKSPCRIVVGRDGRLTSPSLEAALIEGLTDAGARVLRIGVGPTPMVHFADRLLAADASVMVTGSHNPPTHNGFKLSHRGSPYFGEAIQRLARAPQGPLPAVRGGVEAHSIGPRYAAAVCQGLCDQIRPLRVAWDAGNGAAGAVLEDLVKHLPGEHRILNGTVDGSFPAHHPDPSKHENLAQLVAAVRADHMDLGIAFDGDGDRLGVVDGDARPVSPDHVLCVLAEDVLARSPGAAVLVDVKTSESVLRHVSKLGGRPVLGRTGHAFMRSRVQAGDALFAGENSGHMFFADEHPGYDDALYAAARLLRALREGPPLAERCAALPRMFGTPELRIPCPDERKFDVVLKVRDDVIRAGIAPNTLDGVRVSSGAGWWLLRASHTEAAIVVRCETYEEDDLPALRANIHDVLADAGIDAGILLAR